MEACRNCGSIFYERDSEGAYRCVECETPYAEGEHHYRWGVYVLDVEGEGHLYRCGDDATLAWLMRTIHEAVALGRVSVTIEEVDDV
jgi:hypothetical protein